MAISLLRGLTYEKIEQIRSSSAPLDIRLMIGGQEFPLEGITLQGGGLLSAAIVKTRDELDDLIKNHLPEQAAMIGKTVEETRLVLAERAFVLDRLIWEFSWDHSGSVALWGE